MPPKLDSLTIFAIDAASSDFGTVALYLLYMIDREEEEIVQPIPRAPRRFLLRDRKGTGMLLWNDYFSDNPIFPGDYFRRRYRMSRPLFIRICQGIINYSQEPVPDYFLYFRQRPDATGLLGFNVFQKCTSAIRQLAYGTAPDAFDEYLHMGQQTSYDCLNIFRKSVFHLYANEYLRKPTPQDIQRPLYKRRSWIPNYHVRSGCIATLVKSFKSPPTPEAAKFKRFQEAARKDIERVFGVLQGRGAIIKNPSRQFYVERIRRIMHTCVILHNMITEDNGRAMCDLEENYRPARLPRRSIEERVQAHIRANKEL
ncbi:uncharacterized protein [Rutidosis leptorrhynchoides]|uniref:uncharacterized protein n=1 Tax=Rutidosis leptorrhynchoides TaxID=125765 RepID=UPI003A9970B3